jgi:hypothetical protein
MDREKLGDEPPIVLKARSCFLVLSFEFYILQRGINYRKVAPFVCYGPNPFENVSEIIDNPLANLLQGVYAP